MNFSQTDVSDKTSALALELYRKEDMVESAVVAKAFVANDIDNKNQWTINEVHILKNNNIKENILLLRVCY
nr:hypothetical protein [Mycoplasmopsis bovis]